MGCFALVHLRADSGEKAYIEIVAEAAGAECGRIAVGMEVESQQGLLMDRRLAIWGKKGQGVTRGVFGSGNWMNLPSLWIQGSCSSNLCGLFFFFFCK